MWKWFIRKCFQENTARAAEKWAWDRKEVKLGRDTKQSQMEGSYVKRSQDCPGVIPQSQGSRELEHLFIPPQPPSMFKVLMRRTWVFPGTAYFPRSMPVSQVGSCGPKAALWQRDAGAAYWKWKHPEGSCAQNVRGSWGWGEPWWHPHPRHPGTKCSG